jgi:hypothetical protein
VNPAPFELCAVWYEPNETNVPVESGVPGGGAGEDQADAERKALKRRP